MAVTVIILGRTSAHRLAAHAQTLHLVEAHRHRTWSFAGHVLADRDVVHVHGILLGHRRGVGRTHRIAVVFYLAVGAGRIGGVRAHATADHC
jgi:hypothetical protein